MALLSSTQRDPVALGDGLVAVRVGDERGEPGGDGLGGHPDRAGQRRGSKGVRDVVRAGRANVGDGRQHEVVVTERARDEMSRGDAELAAAPARRA